MDTIMNKMVQSVFVVRLKKKGFKPVVWVFENLTIRKVHNLISGYIESQFHDCFWTICENGIEIKRYKYIQK